MFGRRDLAVAAGEQHIVDATPRPRLEPVVCRSWCGVGDGHGDAMHVDDQCCLSPTTTIELSQHAPLPDARYDAATQSPVPMPEWVEVYVYQQVDKAPQLHITRSGDPETRYTADEARQLLAAL